MNGRFTPEGIAPAACESVAIEKTKNRNYSACRETVAGSDAAISTITTGLPCLFEARVVKFTSGNDAAAVLQKMGSANFRKQISKTVHGIDLHRILINPCSRLSPVIPASQIPEFNQAEEN